MQVAVNYVEFHMQILIAFMTYFCIISWNMTEKSTKVVPLYYSKEIKKEKLEKLSKLFLTSILSFDM